MAQKLTEEEKQKLLELSKLINIDFKKLHTLKAAFIHRSYLNEANKLYLKNNERLEFLGDAVLELLVSEFLFTKFPSFNEGKLTSFRAAVVKTESLAYESRRLGLGKYLYLSKGEETSGGRDRLFILANTFEALLGAVYTDRGIKTCKEFLEKNLFYKIDDIVKNNLDVDAKSKLQEISQEKLKLTPKYILVKQTGPDHDRIFVMMAVIGEEKFEEGSGKSKQEAEQKAALNTLEKLNQRGIF